MDSYKKYPGSKTQWTFKAADKQNRLQPTSKSSKICLVLIALSHWTNKQSLLYILLKAKYIEENKIYRRKDSCIVAHLVPNVFFESNYSIAWGLQPYGQVQYEMYMDTDLLKKGMIAIWCDYPLCLHIAANLASNSCPPKKRKWFKQDAQINTMKNLKGNQQHIYIRKHSSNAGKHQTRSTRTEYDLKWSLNVFF